jgi:hypothetical protein
MVVVVPYLQLVGIRQISPSLLVAGAKIHTKLILSSCSERVLTTIEKVSFKFFIGSQVHYI